MTLAGDASPTDLTAPSPLPEPEFRLDADALWFWVRLPDARVMRASLSRSVLRYALQGQTDGSDAVSVYALHRAAIDAAVLRRVAAGSLEPVMLREFDLRTPPT